MSRVALPAAEAGEPRDGQSSAGGAARLGRVVSVLLACVLLSALAVGPFLAYHDAPPLQRDSMTWIERTAPSAEGRFDWALRETHFIAYRPVTALSFLATQAAVGPCERALRGTDLALHALATLLLFALGARLFGILPGLFGALLFVVHPASDEVVTYLARRSYSLAVVGSTTGFLLATYAARGRRLALLATGPVLAAGLFANELGGVLALALPVVAFTAAGRDRRGRAAFVTLIGWASVAAGVWWRSRIVQGGDGYVAGEVDWGRAGIVARYFGSALAGRFEVDGGASGLDAAAPASFLGPVLELSLLAALAAISLWLALGARRLRAPLALLVVLAAYGAVAAQEGVWFPRQIYCANVLLALFGASVAASLRASRDASRRDAAGETTRLGLTALPLLVLFVVLLLQSPLVRGTKPARLARAEAATALVQGVLGSLEELEGPANVALAAQVELEAAEPTAVLAPERAKRVRIERHMRMPFLWLETVTANSDVHLRDVAYVVRGARQAAMVEWEPGATIHLADEAVAFEVRRGMSAQVPASVRTIRVRRPDATDVAAYLWSNFDDLGSGRMEPLRR